MAKHTEQRPLPYWPVTTRDVPPLGLHVKKQAPDPAQMARLAAYLGVLSVRDFALDVTVSPVAGDGLRVNGFVRATVEQACVVTLESVTNALEGAVDVTFLPQQSMPEPVEPDEDEPMPEEDPPDLLVDDTVDLGMVAAEFLLLAVDPYPRREGASFGIQGDGDAVSPFQALAALKKDD